MRRKKGPSARNAEGLVLSIRDTRHVSRRDNLPILTPEFIPGERAWCYNRSMSYDTKTRWLCALLIFGALAVLYLWAITHRVAKPAHPEGPLVWQGY